MATGGEITQGINMPYDTITQIIEDARASVYRTANFHVELNGMVDNDL